MIKDSLSKIQLLFKERKVAYCQTFTKDSRAARLVLEDLAKFCRSSETTYTTDPRLSNVLEGRREVWLRIQNYLNLTTEEIYRLHHIKTGE